MSGDVAVVEDEERVPVEGDADWRPWSGGHESPLEALWQWMVARGVGGLKEEPAAEPSVSEASTEEPVGFAAVDAAATADSGDVKIGGGAIHF